MKEALKTMMRHAVGFDSPVRYRNYFAVACPTNIGLWREAVAAGYAGEREGWGGQKIFHVTASGLEIIGDERSEG